jgi:hypothetical protein
MAPEASPLVSLAQQGAEAANYIIAERLVGNPRRDSSADNRSNNWMRRAQSEAASLASNNCHLADNDAQRRITQNHYLWEIGHARDDLRNVIEDRRSLRARSLTPPRWSLSGDVTPSGRGSFHALAAPLRKVRWPLARVLQNKEAMGWIAQRAVEIGQYDVEFIPRRAIKSQALVDFITEWTNSGL